MFTHPRPAPFGRPHQLANTYARVGVETNVNVASPHKLIALLFDGLADSLVIARSAMAAGQMRPSARPSSARPGSSRKASRPA